MIALLLAAQLAVAGLQEGPEQGIGWPADRDSGSSADRTTHGVVESGRAGVTEHSDDRGWWWDLALRGVATVGAANPPYVLDDDGHIENLGPREPHVETTPISSRVVVSRFEPPTFEGWAGRYQAMAQQPDGTFVSKPAWQGMAQLRTPSWRGLRLFGQAETAAQPGALAAKSLETWNGAETVLGLSYDGWRASSWSLSPAVAAGGVFALGEDRQRVDVTPSLLAAGLRAEYRAGGASIRLYAGAGRHGAVSDGVVGIGDVLVRLPLLGDRLALHARVYTGKASSWRYGIVGRWW